MNASPVDFTAAPAADVFPRKAPHPGERRTLNAEPTEGKTPEEARGATTKEIYNELLYH
ncbi:hypothetical protein RU50_005439 [Salmonella enterica subsp. enterica]|nr:hypothetical protein [Salmonella enterica subsp. enterica]